MSGVKGKSGRHATSISPLSEVASQICRVCSEDKPLTEFDLRGDTGRYETRCIECRRDTVRERSKYRYYENPEKSRARSNIFRRMIRRAVLEAYGGACSCCGETEEAFLALDHVAGGGAGHRRSLGGTGNAVYIDVIRRGFPEDFQILCHNCNIAKHHQGVCPHQLKEEE